MTEYLSKGAFGCVLYPSIPCISEDSNATNNDLRSSSTFVSKIFEKHSQVEDEFEAHKKVTEADQQQKFSLPPPRKCVFNKEVLHNVTNFYKCNMKIEDISHEQLIFEYGGYDLLSIPKNYTFYDIFPYFEKIMYGIVLMNRNNMVHSDIKPLNILFSPKDKQMYLIDFGLLSKKDTFYSSDNQFILSHKYLFYPPEFKLYNLRKSESIHNYLERNCYHKYFTNGEQLMRDSYNKLKKQLEKTTDIDSFFNTFANKIDVYALGMVIHYCFLRYGPNRKRTKSTSKSDNDSTINNLVFQMTHPDPYKRLAPEDALNELKRSLEIIESQITKKYLKNRYNEAINHKKRPIIKVNLDRNSTLSLKLQCVKNVADIYGVPKNILDTNDYDTIYKALRDHISKIKNENTSFFTKNQLKNVANLLDIRKTGSKEELIHRLGIYLEEHNV